MTYKNLLYFKFYFVCENYLIYNSFFINEIKIPFKLIYSIVLILFKFNQIVLALKYCCNLVKLLSLKHCIYSFLFEKSINLNIEKYKLTHVHDSKS